MNSASPLRRPFKYSYANATIWLVGINALVFFLTAFSPRLYALLGMSVSGVLGRGWVWQVFTYMFCHDTRTFTHILFNMIGLWIFGTEIERRVGTREFVFFYLLMGLLSGVFSLGAYALMGLNIHLVGASGALFALLLLFATFFPDARIMVWGILPVRAPVLVIGYAAIEIFSEVFSLGGGVAHLTHLAGFGFAWLYCLVRYGINPWSRFFLR